MSKTVQKAMLIALAFGFSGCGSDDSSSAASCSASTACPSGQVCQYTQQAVSAQAADCNSICESKFAGCPQIDLPLCVEFCGSSDACASCIQSGQGCFMECQEVCSNPPPPPPPIDCSAVCASKQDACPEVDLALCEQLCGASDDCANCIDDGLGCFMECQAVCEDGGNTGGGSTGGGSTGGGSTGGGSTGGGSTGGGNNGGGGAAASEPTGTCVDAASDNGGGNNGGGNHGGAHADCNSICDSLTGSCEAIDGQMCMDLCGGSTACASCLGEGSGCADNCQEVCTGGGGGSGNGSGAGGSGGSGNGGGGGPNCDPTDPAGRACDDAGDCTVTCGGGTTGSCVTGGCASAADVCGEGTPFCFTPN